MPLDPTVAASKNPGNLRQSYYHHSVIVVLNHFPKTRIIDLENIWSANGLLKLFRLGLKLKNGLKLNYARV